MLDLKKIRENPEGIESQLRRRDPSISLKEILSLDERLRVRKSSLDDMRNKLNTASTEIGRRKKAGESADELIRDMSSLSEQIKEAESEEKKMQTDLFCRLSFLPNLPHPSVPTDMNKAHNVVVRKSGTQVEFDFSFKNHLEISRTLGILDFERGAKVAGSQFPLYVGWGALLEQALLMFMLHTNASKGYRPILPPYLINEQTMFASGNLPKFEEQLYRCRDDDFFLLPTSEVPLTGLHRDEILDEQQLPIRYTSMTACFRREAGTYGSEERGLVRVHQFNKVEMYKIVTPESSYDELESLVADAEDLCRLLNLHYRTSLLVTGDIGNQSAKTYDVEVWLPGQNAYYEVSSCSNCEDYQARRGNIRCRPGGSGGKGKLRHPHTLNGSGLATSRLMVCILESNQQPDGSVVVPEVLRPYMMGREILEPARGL